MRTIVLDTETTGLDPRTSRIVEIAIVDGGSGKPLLDTLINPGQPIPADATAIHGITDADVADAPTMIEVLPCVLGLARDAEVVIYNAAYDTQFLPYLRDVAGTVQCAMLAAQSAMSVDRWPKLAAAAAWAGYDWAGTTAHRALADTLAARAVWLEIIARRFGGEESHE